MTNLAITDLPADEYARIFGAPQEERVAGKTRLCKVCGGWHRTSAWPHNCRREAPPRSHLAAPRIAPRFEAFVANQLTGEVVDDPRSKREYMARHDLVEYDEGVKPDPEPTQRQWVEEFAQDVKRAIQTDPLSVPPVDVIGRTDTDGAGDIDMADVPVFDNMAPIPD